MSADVPVGGGGDAVGGGADVPLGEGHGPVGHRGGFARCRPEASSLTCGLGWAGRKGWMLVRAAGCSRGCAEEWAGGQRGQRSLTAWHGRGVWTVEGGATAEPLSLAKAMARARHFGFRVGHSGILAPCMARAHCMAGGLDGRSGALAKPQCCAILGRTLVAWQSALDAWYGISMGRDTVVRDDR